MAVAYAPGGLIKVGPFPLTGSGAPASTLIGQLGQDYFDTTTSPPTAYLFNGSTWVQQVVSGASGGSYPGNSSGVAPAAGFLGEQIRSAVAVGSAIALTTATPANVTSISLTPGIWDVSGLIMYHNITASTITAGQNCSISTTTATLGTTGDNNALAQWLSASLAQGDAVVSLPAYRLSLTTTTSAFLVAQTSFSAGTMSAYGRISATRVA